MGLQVLKDWPTSVHQICLYQRITGEPGIGDNDQGNEVGVGVDRVVLPTATRAQLIDSVQELVEFLVGERPLDVQTVVIPS
jgi:hypothetical protein